MHPYGVREGPYLIATGIRVNALVKKFCSSHVAATNCLPQNGPHCFAHTPRGTYDESALQLSAHQSACTYAGSKAASLTSAGAARKVAILSARH